MHGIDRGRAGRPGDAVLVTGSSTGLGLETALHLAAARLPGLRHRARRRARATRCWRPPAGAASRSRSSELDLTDSRQHPARRSQAVAATPAASTRSSTTPASACAARRGLLAGRDPAAVRDERARHHRGHAGRPAAPARGGLRADRHHHLGRRARPRLRRVGLLLEQVRAGGPRRGRSRSSSPRSASSPSSSSPGSSRRSAGASTAATAGGRGDPSSPYHARFWASEAIADKLVERSPTHAAATSPRTVARGAHRRAAAAALRRRPRRARRDLPAPPPARAAVRAPVLRRPAAPAGAPHAAARARRRPRGGAAVSRVLFTCWPFTGHVHAADEHRGGAARARARGRLLQRRGAAAAVRGRGLRLFAFERVDEAARHRRTSSALEAAVEHGRPRRG